MVACALSIPKLSALGGAVAKNRKAASLTLPAVKPGLACLFSDALKSVPRPLCSESRQGLARGPAPSQRRGSERGARAPASGSASFPPRRPTRSPLIKRRDRSEPPRRAVI